MAPRTYERAAHLEAGHEGTDSEEQQGWASRPHTGGALTACLFVSFIACVVVGVMLLPAGDGTEQNLFRLDADTTMLAATKPKPNRTCPSGYTRSRFDMMNGADGHHEKKANLEDCAWECDKDYDCKGFEHNAVAQHCWTSRGGANCTKKQSHGWLSCRKEGTNGCDGDKCPSGYVHTHLDLSNHDADMHEKKESIQECAKECSANKTCKGFEHNAHAQHCWISRGGHDCEKKQHTGWLTCVKEGQKDNCTKIQH